MGYSIAAIARNKELLVQMWNFLQKNYTEPKKLFDKEHSRSRLAYNLDDESNHLSYDHSEFAIGFDYNACDPEREYIFSVVRWIALKIGEKRLIEECKDLGEVYFYVYDGGDKCPIITDNLGIDFYKDSVVSNVGYYSQSEKILEDKRYEDEGWYKQMVEEYKISDKLINDELQRLELTYNETYSN
jgi:hypothetical protein